MLRTEENHPITLSSTIFWHRLLLIYFVKCFSGVAELTTQLLRLIGIFWNTVRACRTYRGSLAGFESCNLQLVQGLGHHAPARWMHWSCPLGGHLACVRGDPIHRELLVRAEGVAAQCMHGERFPTEVGLKLVRQIGRASCRERVLRLV